jgi:hypothetical protein
LGGSAILRKQTALNRWGETVAKAQKSLNVATLDQRTTSKDRRGSDRRKANAPVAVERRKSERRQKVNRRRQIDPTTCERDYTPDEVEFMHAMDLYKRSSGRMFPTCSEVLEVLKNLGYEKVRPTAGTVAGSVNNT